MDIAALTLEDQYPELSPSQVRHALAQAHGDLQLAAQLCQRLLDGSAAKGGAATWTSAFDAAANQPGEPVGSAHHRHWWPAISVPGEVPTPQYAAAPMSMLQQQQQNGTASGSHTASTGQAQPAAGGGNGGARPAVRVIQRHTKPSPDDNQGEGVLPSAATANQYLPSGAIMAAAQASEASGSSGGGLHYAAVFLSESSRDRVLQHAPPLHEAVSADHLTLAYRPTLEQALGLPLGREVPLFVEGVASDYRTQALAVQHPSWLSLLTGSVPHVTISVADGVAAREAGDLVRDAREGAVRVRISPLVGVKILHGTVGVKLDDCIIAYSQEELLEGLRRLQQRPHPLDQAAPVKILKRGELPHRAPAPAPAPSAHPQAAPPPPQAVVGGFAAAAATERVEVSAYSSPTDAGVAVMARVSAVSAEPSAPAAQPPPDAGAPPSLDDLLDMLHMADAGPPGAGASGAKARAAPSSGTGVAAARQAPRVAVGVGPARHVPGILSRGRPSSAPQPQQPQHPQQQAPAPTALPWPAPQLAAAQRASHAVPPAGAAPLSAAAPTPLGGGGGFGEFGGVDEGGPLDLLTALAERLGGGGSQAQQAAQPPRTSAPPTFNPLPLLPPPHPPLQQQQQAFPAGPKAPAPARTLADFLPAGLAQTPSSPQAPPPLSFLVDTPAPAGSAAIGAAGWGVRGQAPGRAAPPRRHTASGGGATGGYESSGSSGAEAEGLAAAYGACGSPPRTESDLRRAFPEVEAEVLEAALEIHAGDVAEVASFLAALQMEQQDLTLGRTAPDPSQHAQQPRSPLPPPPQQQYRPSGPGGGGGAGAGAAGFPRRGGGRAGGGSKGGGGGRGRGHTGASDPLAVTERQAMSLHLAAKNMYEKAARAAAARGAHALSKDLAATSRHHADLGNAARRRANSTAYRTSNSAVTNIFKVDLHGLHVEEALQVLERHLVNLGGLGHPGGIILEVVTGVGRHSSAGQPRLLPAVVRFLSDAGYRFDTQEGNTGVVDVFIGC